MGRFKGGLKCKGWVNSVIINVFTDAIAGIFFKYNYSVKTCMYLCIK